MSSACTKTEENIYKKYLLSENIVNNLMAMSRDLDY